jgi:hypothetical protein
MLNYNIYYFVKNFIFNPIKKKKVNTCRVFVCQVQKRDLLKKYLQKKILKY